MTSTTHSSDRVFYYEATEKINPNQSLKGCYS